jgi:hypothetical protein
MKYIKLFESFNDKLYKLMKYLTMTEEEKESSMAYDEVYRLEEWFYDEVVDAYEDEEDVIEDIENVMSEHLVHNPDKVLKYIEENHVEIFEWFVSYTSRLYKEGEYNGSLSSDAEKPSWVYLEFVEMLNDVWLLHITTKKNAEDIKKHGFRKGIQDHTRLGQTTFLDDSEKEFGGYNYAYTIHDFDSYALENGEYKYGDTVLLFKADAIRCYHKTDGEHQAIFWGSSANNIHIITSQSPQKEIRDISK